MSDSVSPDPSGITDELIELGAQAIAEGGIGMRGQLYPVESPDFPAHRRRVAETVLRGALAGRAVVDLPEPDGTDNEGDPLWELGGNEVVIAYRDTNGHPIIRLPDGDDVAPEWAEMYVSVLSAAVRDSRQLSADGTVRVCPKCSEHVEALPHGRACDQCLADSVRRLAAEQSSGVAGGGAR